VSVRLLHLSDTHLSGPGAVPNFPDVDAVRRLEQVLNVVATHAPFDVLVITGDVCDDGSTEAARTVRDLVAPVAPIVFAVPGNHDHSDVIADVFGIPEAELGPWQLVGAATNVPGQVAGVAAPVVDVLDTMPPDRPAVVLAHHPLRSPSTHEWFTLPDADVLEERLLRRTGPTVLLSGHTHQPGAARVGSARLLGAPSTWYGLRHDGPDWTVDVGLTGARIVELHADGAVGTQVLSA
jgi:3',5'-cyclic-AMP phosphodiesterase